MGGQTEYDVALSFAGEDRAYVDQVAHSLRDQGVKVFYDLFEEADLWGKDLFTHLIETYRDKARFTVIFISAAYKEKLWTNHERRAAQARAFQECAEYILPARFDRTEIPGVLSTTGYIDLCEKTPSELAALISRKLVAAGHSVPSQLVRREFGPSVRISDVESSRFTAAIVDDLGCAIAGCVVTAQASNGTTLEGITLSGGVVELAIPIRRKYRILISHPQYPATIIEEIDPVQNLSITLNKQESVGSVVIHSTGYIPGLEGRINPILDTVGRTYLYADNIAIDGGKPQPASFTVNEPIELEDANGVFMSAVIKAIHGRVSLIQYTRGQSSEH